MVAGNKKRCWQSQRGRQALSVLAVLVFPDCKNGIKTDKKIPPRTYRLLFLKKNLPSDGRKQNLFMLK
jgi:hypothetical protein